MQAYDFLVYLRSVDSMEAIISDIGQCKAIYRHLAGKRIRGYAAHARIDPH